MAVTPRKSVPLTSQAERYLEQLLDTYGAQLLDTTGTSPRPRAGEAWLLEQALERGLKVLAEEASAAAYEALAAGMKADPAEQSERAAVRARRASRAHRAGPSPQPARPA